MNTTATYHVTIPLNCITAISLHGMHHSVYNTLHNSNMINRSIIPPVKYLSIQIH